MPLSSRRITRCASTCVLPEPAFADTQADTAGVPDPWTVPLTGSSYARVSAAVPWIGYPFVVDGGWVLLLMAAAAALALPLTIGRRPPATVAEPRRPRQPVG